MMRTIKMAFIAALFLVAMQATTLAYETIADDDALSRDRVANNTVMLEAVMSMYGAKRRGRNQVLDKAQLRDILNFGKNSTRELFIRQMQDRLKKTAWKSLLQCESVETLLNDTGLSTADGVNGTAELAELLPRLFFAMQNPDCYIEKPKPRALTDPMAWLYSLLAVLVMKLCALVGILAFPCMNATVFTMALAFLVPLAISSLMGSTLFIFLPQILKVAEIAHYEENFGEPAFKLVAVGGGIYLFYLIEKLLRLLMEHKERQYYRKSANYNRSYSLHIAEDNIDKQRASRKISTTMAGDVSTFSRERIQTMRDSRVELTEELGSNGAISEASSAAGEGKEKIAPIAWIAIMGDCIRNFIDGIAIGAAFSISPLVGLSLSLAFVFEEIPTELGDVAILLSVGMTICRASMYHCMAAVFAFFGAACGILLGDLGESQIWIFAISAGAFLYIALVDLMPEMNHALESDRAKGVGRFKIFLLQNAGLVFGFAVTAVLGIYKDEMHIDLGH